MHTNHIEVVNAALAAFPGYAGRKFRVEPFTHPENCSHEWGGGSRESWSILDLATLKSAPCNGTRIEALPVNGALARHTIFCGKDLGITLYVHPDALAGLLPARVELSRDERVALAIAGQLKSFARLESATRDFHMTPAQYEAAKTALKARGLLNAQGAITNEGRNQRDPRQLWTIAAEERQALRLLAA